MCGIQKLLFKRLPVLGGNSGQGAQSPGSNSAPPPPAKGDQGNQFRFILRGRDSCQRLPYGAENSAKGGRWARGHRLAHAFGGSEALEVWLHPLSLFPLLRSGLKGIRRGKCSLRRCRCPAASAPGTVKTGVRNSRAISRCPDRRGAALWSCSPGLRGSEMPSSGGQRETVPPSRNLGPATTQH